MATDGRISDLLRTWDEARERGQMIAVEVLCRDNPELAPELQRRIDAMMDMDWLDDTGGSASTGPHSPVSPPEAGREIIPGHRLIRRLGKGGYGEVWEAAGSGIHLALKCVALGSGIDATELNALRVMQSVRHAHLLVITGVWEEPGWLIIGMELADCTLADRLDQALKQEMP